mgnify:CR=1 FL=1|jgi:hypothetical protein
MDSLFVKGMTWGWNSRRGDYRTPEAADSLRKLREAGNEWVCLAFAVTQDHFYSTAIKFDYAHTVTDRDLECAVREARKLGLKICLKPTVNSRDGLWRAHIGFPHGEEEAEPYWEAWFKSYTAFLLHYAELAAEWGCEMFCVGCEMSGTEAQEARWREAVAAVRRVYPGLVVYNANHGREDRVPWWDAVDVIGTSAYYPVGRGGDGSEESMVRNWLPVRDRLKRLHERYDRPVLFMEIGCRSAEGCSAMPWDFKHRDLPARQEEQAAFYRSALRVFWHEPWFAGFFWWDWSVKLYDAGEAALDRGFDIYGKEAERVLRIWYEGEGGR